MLNVFNFCVLDLGNKEEKTFNKKNNKKRETNLMFKIIFHENKNKIQFVSIQNRID